MLTFDQSRGEFAAKRRKAQEEIEEWLLGLLKDSGTSLRAVAEAAADRLRSEYTSETGQPLKASLTAWQRSVARALAEWDFTDPHRLKWAAMWLATRILSEATIRAAQDDEEDVFLEWVSMHDKDVRRTHVDADGQVQPVGEKFTVGEAKMDGPGDTAAPPEEWINCRCTLRPTLTDAFAGGLDEFRLDKPVMWQADPEESPAGGPMETEARAEGLGVPWHGPLAPEGVWSGDRRMFLADSLSHRPLPLPLTWQKYAGAGHDGNVTVGKIEEVYKVDGLMWGAGHLLASSPDADEFTGFLAEFGRFGVSIDADQTEQEMSEDENGVTFSAARISAACAVGIPAFAEAWITLGELPDEVRQSGPQMDAPEDAPDIEEREKVAAALQSQFFDQFVKTEDGPGWLTHPVDTDRLRDYWVHGAGAAKINWGTPGDFNRCRVAVAEYVKPQHLNGYCANRHYDALGFWPGRPVSGETVPFVYETLGIEEAPAPALSLVAAGGFCAPSAWFEDPKFHMGDGRLVQQLDGSYACPLTVTDEGHVYGHISAWSACHLDSVLQNGVCVAPPRSMTDYAYFLNGGVVRLDDGTDAPVGQITLGGGHAAHGLSMRAALAHYDDAGTAVADITVGEDEFGIWCSGWVRPGATDEQITALRAHPVSPDWREARGNLEMIAVLCVNTPGFGIHRPRIGTRDARQVSLVASGIVEHSTASEVDVASLADRVIEEIKNREQRRAEMLALLEGIDA